MKMIFHSLREFDIRKLIQVYAESIHLSGRKQYSHLTHNRQILEAEQDFYYMVENFLHFKDSFYAVNEMDNQYVSALRMEPFRDGFLLSGLETKPDCRRRGYAGSLIQFALEYLSDHGCRKVYSHIYHDNITSINLHLTAGFRKINDSAIFLDGTASSRAGTYVIEI